MDPYFIYEVQPTNPNLVEITSPIQKFRGNRQFFDTKHKVSYITYANGYVRREIKAAYVSPYTTSNKAYKIQDQFVLNKRKGTLTKWGYTSYKSILEPCPQKRMDIIDRISTNYKGYTGRMSTANYNLIPR